MLAILVMGAVLAAAVLYPNGLGGIRQAKTYITVSAEGFASGYPTQAVIYLTANGTGPTANIATANLSLTLQKLNFSLHKYLNGNLSMIRTVSYSLYKQQNSSKYQAVESLQTRIPNVRNLTAALANLSSIQDLYVSQASAVLSSTQIRLLRSQALSDALANATAQAAVLAVNKTLGVPNITVSNYVIYPFALNAGPAASGGFQGQSSLFYTSQEQVSESITATFPYR